MRYYGMWYFKFFWRWYGNLSKFFYIRYLRHVMERKILNFMKIFAANTVICEEIDGITVISNLARPPPFIILKPIQSNFSIEYSPMLSHYCRLASSNVLSRSMVIICYIVLQKGSDLTTVESFYRVLKFLKKVPTSIKSQLL